MFSTLIARSKIIIPTVLLILVGTLGIIFVLKPSLDNFQGVRGELNKYEREYQENSGRALELRDLEEQIKTVGADELTKLKALFVESPEIAHILSVLSDRVTASGFFIGSLEVGKAKEGEAKGPLQEVSIQVQLKGGGYRELKQLLYLLAKTVPLLDFNSFAFQPQNALVGLNVKAKSVADADGTLAVPIDARFFNEANFQNLSAPVGLPMLEAVGRENPFAPLE